MAGWNTGKPIFDRLPGEQEQYTDNSVALALCTPWDELLMSTKDKVDNFYRDFLDPVTAKPENLDWLGQLAGFSGEYGIATYPAAIKRQLIARFDYIWLNKGTRSLLEWLLQIFSIDGQIYQIGDFLADINKAEDVLGGDPFRFWIRLPLKYLRTSNEWLLSEQLRQLYSPIYGESKVVYQEFSADFSAAEDAVFS